MAVRILYTASRKMTDTPANRELVLRAVTEWCALGTRFDDITLVHGGAKGGDGVAAVVAAEHGMREEVHPAREHPTPLLRNGHMVKLGADCCIAFADRWASGTGNCARQARNAGIPTRDYGVDTRSEARP